MHLIDSFGRPITYLRLSVTDRCDFRCVYCMAENMQFLPRDHILSLEEMTLVAQAFSELGVKKIRLTGGEPLIRRNIDQLLKNLYDLSQHSSNSLNELSLTTNGSHLSQYAQALAHSGVQRINVSLDSLKSEKFNTLTRTGNLATVLKGIDSAINAGLKVKLNSVILKHRNIDEVVKLVDFAISKQLDISFIEEMPLGVIHEHQRDKEFVSSRTLRSLIEQHYTLKPCEDSAAVQPDTNTAGPSRYWRINPHTRVGFISPHSDNFCSSCNRVRVTAEGKLLLCLGNENHLDLRHIIRQHPNNIDILKQEIVNSISHKPEKHHFDLAEEPQIVRFMNMTGG